MKEWVVQSGEQPRLEQFLLAQEPALTPGLLHKYLRENKLKVDGKKLPLSARLSRGAVVRFYEPASRAAPAPRPLSVVYEDDEVLIADKPAGLPADGEGGQDSLLLRALRHLGVDGPCTPEGVPPCLCHRLDTGTSGLLLIAKTEGAYATLTALLKTRALKKKYLCVTFGRPKPAEAQLQGWLTKDAASGTVRVYDSPRPGAKEIGTRYRTLAVSGRLALLEVELLTGRTHQIRAHLAAFGCPVLGDSKYGDNAANRELRFKYQALCAYSLTFPPLPAGPCSALSGRSFTLPEPWYAAQLRAGEIK